MSGQTFDSTIATLGVGSTALALGNSPEERHRAVRVVCGHAADATAAAEVLAMLGLNPTEGWQP